ncbi:hypothetical protein F511_34914 [Dorcoceras hygrometricum]|uniref:Uncharacterized protein n=1 Tax=Dorcoceras hygrometricum TaxID=472368 RepID=A0A2Z7DIU2_9LAMI|nr:hypothetical protein F511_34914 [Dorcoceras hygrometricum]
MGLEFRRRDYRAEAQAYSLPRTRVEFHPLSASSTSLFQEAEVNDGKYDFIDPLRATDERMEVSVKDEHRECTNPTETPNSDISAQLRIKEWDSFTKSLMQRFPLPKKMPISMVTSLYTKSHQELDNHHRIIEDLSGVSQQEYISRLHGLKNEIKQAWHADDRIKSLRLSIKVVRLLSDTHAIQCYPSLFVLVTDVMDMLGDLVWNRIKQKAEFDEDGQFIFPLPDNFRAADVLVDAKETSNNWFFKISSVSELVPRIYLELAISPCWRFLLDSSEEFLQRLVAMTRGIADPLVSAYCRLYLVQCAQRLPKHDKRYLIICINDLQVTLMRLMSAREATDGNILGSNTLPFALIEPTIEYLIRYLFKDLKQVGVGNMLVALGITINPAMSFENCTCISIFLHHILKELPIGFTFINAVEILHLISYTNDSSFDQCLNFKLLGFRLCERISEVNKVHLVVEKIIQVLSHYERLDAYLIVTDAFLDIIFGSQQDTFPKVLLDGIFAHTHQKEIGDSSMETLHSILLKFLNHFGNIEDILSLAHFIDIVDMMHGSSRNSINMHILSMATSGIKDPTIIEVLFEVAQNFYDGVDFLSMRMDDYQNKVRVISRFVFMMDFGMDVESHLRFLARCRGAFASISELQEIIVHSTNNLAVTAMRDVNRDLNFVKSCLAFNEVTIPSICTNLRQLSLYLETTEVALLGGFLSHAYELLNAAVTCLENTHSVDGFRVHEDVDWIVSLICKLCGILVMVPGSLELGVASIPKHVLTFLDSKSWYSVLLLFTDLQEPIFLFVDDLFPCCRILPRMKARVLCAVLVLSAALSQNPLLYNAVSLEGMSNDRLFFGVPAYPLELLSLSGSVLQAIAHIVLQEPELVFFITLLLHLLLTHSPSLLTRLLQHNLNSVSGCPRKNRNGDLLLYCDIIHDK